MSLQARFFVRRVTATDAKYTLIGRRLKVQPEVVMPLKTRVFEFSNRKYTNLNKLAQAMGISLSQIYRARQGKRPINERIIIGALKAFPGYKIDDLFHVAPDGGQNN